MTEHDNLVVLRTFSKAMGPRGGACGRGASASPSILLALRILQDPYSFNVVAQSAVRDRIDGYDEVRAGVDLIRSERERVRVELASIKAVDRPFASDANFLCLRIRTPLVLEAFERESIVAANTSSLLPSSVRITIGTREENDRMLEVLRSVNVAS